jgi:hypothetical protein
MGYEILLLERFYNESQIKSNLNDLQDQGDSRQGPTVSFY